MSNELVEDIEVVLQFQARVEELKEKIQPKLLAYFEDPLSPYVDCVNRFSQLEFDVIDWKKDTKGRRTPFEVILVDDWRGGVDYYNIPVRFFSDYEGWKADRIVEIEKAKKINTTKHLEYLRELAEKTKADYEAALAKENP